MKRTNIISMFLIFLMTFICSNIYSNAFAEETKPPEEKKPLYHAGPWSGKIIDTETKKPIEGALVSVIWYRDYDTRFTLYTTLHESKEVLTDSNGYFEIPAYTETGENKDKWPKPKLAGVELFVGGPVIRDPEFIIFKPGIYYYFPMKVEFIIYAAGPSVVEYQEFGSNRKSTKEFPEGVVYTGFKCFPVMEKLSEKVNYRIEAVFLPLENAKEKIKQLDIPLDCPKKKVEAVPSSAPGFKYDLGNPLKKGGYAVIGMSKIPSDAERVKALPREPMFSSAENLPLLYRFIKEENEKVNLLIKEREEKQKKERERK